MPRFVILRHETPPGFARTPSGGAAHWDFMLECEGTLRTWALAEAPSPGCELVAEELADHRLAYLEHEGEVSGGRGTVSRWDEGTYEVLGGGEPAAGLRLTPALSPKGEREMRTLRVVLHGRTIAGEVVLTPQSRHAPRAVGQAFLPAEQAGMSAEQTGTSAPHVDAVKADGTRRVPATLPHYWRFSWKGN